MRTTSIPAIGLATSLLSLFCAAPAVAAEEDVQLWGYLEVQAPIAKDWTVALETSPRLIDDGDQVESRLLVEYKGIKGVELGGGVIHVFRPGGDEIRPFQQIELKSGAFEARTRVEERIFNGAPRMEWRLRQRIGASHDISDTTAVTADAELFYIVRTRDAARKTGVDDWRFSLGVEHAVNDHLDLSAGYMLILSPNGSDASTISHVPQLGVKYSF